MRYRTYFVSAVTCIGLASVPALAQSVKLSGAMAETAVGSAGGGMFTPDATRVVYIGPGPALLVGPADGSAAPVAVADLAGTGLALSSFQITADGERAVYLTVQTGQAIENLHSVPLDGSQPPTQLTQLPAQGRVFDYLIDAEATRVVYAADALVDEVVELFSVPIDGSAPAVRISGPLVAGADVEYDHTDDGIRKGFQISPEGSRVAYLVNQFAAGTRELFSVPVDGGASPILLNSPGSHAWEYFLIDPAGEHVVYVAGTIGVTVPQVFSAAIDGTRTVQLSRARSSSFPRQPRITPDGRTVLFRADGQLFRAPIDGRPHVPHAAKAGRARERVNGPLIEGGRVDSYEISADGRRVVYRESQEFQATGLYSVPLFDASAWVRLSANHVPSASASSYRITPDGANVLFKDSGAALYAVPIEGGDAPVQVLESVALFDVTADGSQVLYLSSPVRRLFSVAVSGSQAPIQLNPQTLVSYVPNYDVAPVGRRVLYRSNHETASSLELYSVPADGSASSVRVNAALPRGPSDGDVKSFEITADGSQAVYLADQEFDEVNELWSVPTSGAAIPEKLSDVLHGSGDVLAGFQLSPDESRALFVSNREFLFLLYDVPLDGSAAPRLLTPNNARQVFEPIQITPDGSQAIYLSSEVDVGRVDIFSVQTDGSLQRLQLNPFTVSGVQEDFLITPDSQRVVYRRDGTVGNFDLCSATIGPGQDEVLLGTLVQINSGQFALASGGARVLFLSSGNRLYSVPADGSQAALQFSTQGVQFRASLSGTRVAFTFNNGGLFSRPVDGSQPELSLDPAGIGWPVVTGGAVFYRRGDAELWGAALNGSQGPTLLTPPLPAGGGLGNQAISASQGRAVYTAWQGPLEPSELFSVPTNGSQTAIRLNAPLVAGGEVSEFAITPDGSEVVYRADQDEVGVHELFVVPIAGGTPTRLNGPLVAGGDVQSFRVGAGGRVFYLADEDTDEVIELYMSP